MWKLIAADGWERGRDAKAGDDDLLDGLAVELLRRSRADEVFAGSEFATGGEGLVSKLW